MAKKATNKMAVSPPEAETSAASSHAAIEPTSPKIPAWLSWVPALSEVELSDDAKALLREYLAKGYRGEITAALLHKAVEIRDFLEKADSRDILARYHVGFAIREMWGDPVYGDNSYAKLAKLVGRSLSLIHNLANIAGTWPGVNKFAEVIAKTNDNGKQLKLAHLIALTRVDDAERRQNLMNEALNQGWTAEELAVRCSSTSTPPPPRNPVAPTAVADTDTTAGE